jgi:hypothetical protein
MGKVVQPLQSVNYHDSRAYGHERREPFTQLVGFGWVCSAGVESSRSSSWYVVGGMPVSIGQFWLQM